ncbi:hypothetical protein H6G97_43875 [Nostoc flagelliforme FACHB-838]|uniref:DUF1963 domain-containing protein n=1 Tax=Nostoc flagelliforme FACHB-838 TaxID=2692904 RepID=A0ABR8E2E7_9NOSO|nr:hypothetical protein [Nostoc flagelliforme]MBD2535907.1 hypothetical protein [Nostoc flagelliforme FACHB-838]
MVSKVTEILKNLSLTVEEKAEKIAEILSALPDKGAEETVRLILNADDYVVATYAANYLALLPNLQQEKIQAIEHILNNDKILAIAATNLVKAMPDDVVNQLINKYFQNPEDSDFSNIIYEVAQWFPDKLHPFAAQFKDSIIEKVILPGAADNYVEDLVKKYREEEDPQYLQTLVYIRTDKALDALITLSKTVPEEDLEDIYAYIESSGVFPETRKASLYWKNYRGYIVSRNESPHQMGGSFPHPVPKCPVTDIPANRILTLDLSQLDLGLKSGYNPSFFWYESGYSPGYIYVQFTEDGLKGLITPMTDGEVGTDLIPGELALKLEEYPLKYGRAGEAIPGFSYHQVGGYPNWIRFERFPSCPICDERMKFLVSIDSGMTPFGKLGFNGILYGFWCDPCAVSCTSHQSYMADFDSDEDEDDFE